MAWQAWMGEDWPGMARQGEAWIGRQGRASWGGECGARHGLAGEVWRGPAKRGQAGRGAAWIGRQDSMTTLSAGWVRHRVDTP